MPGILIEQPLQTLELSVLQAQKKEAHVKQIPLCQHLAFSMTAPRKMDTEQNRTAIEGYPTKKTAAHSMSVQHHARLIDLTWRGGSLPFLQPSYPEASYPEMTR